jgi:hypothetical protein
MDQAVRIVSDLRINKAVWGKKRARQEWTPQEQWRNFAPLLGLEPKPGDGDAETWRQIPAHWVDANGQETESTTVSRQIVEAEAVPA